MKIFLKYFLCFVFLYLCLILSVPKVLAMTEAGCNKVLKSGNDINAITCKNPTGNSCSVVNNASDGYSYGCAYGYSSWGQVQCYINDANCENYNTGYKCHPQLYYCDKSSYTCQPTYNIYNGLTYITDCEQNLATAGKSTNGICYVGNDSDGCNSTNCKAPNCVCDNTSSLANSTCSGTSYTQAATGSCSAMTCPGQKICNFLCTSANYVTECNDNDACTIDGCTNPDTVNAQCIHTRITTGTCAVVTPISSTQNTCEYCSSYYANKNGKTCIETSSVTIPEGYIVPENCSCLSSVTIAGWCPANKPYLCGVTFAPNEGRNTYGYVFTSEDNPWKATYFHPVYGTGTCYDYDACHTSGGLMICGGVCTAEEQCPTTFHTDTKYVAGGVDSNGLCTRKECPPNIPVNGFCGRNNGQYISYIINNNYINESDFCTTGSPVLVSDTPSLVKWNCVGSNGGSTVSCSTLTCPAAQSCPTTCHTSATTVPNGSCGITTCPANAPAAGTCPTTCHTSATTVPNGSCGITTCPANAPAKQNEDTCHTSSQTLSNGDCTTTTYQATCDTTCATGYCDSAPSFQSLVIKNNNGNIVAAEAGNRNHICQITSSSSYGFNGVRRATFEVTASDPDGVIPSVTLTWTDSNNVYHTIPVLGRNGNVFTFGWSDTDIPNTDEWNDNSAHPLVVTVTDGYLTVSDSSRSFKFWDCGVSVNGTFFDGTDYNKTDGIPGVICPDTGFTKIADQTILNLGSSFSFIETNSRSIANMTVNSPANIYSSGSNKLIWGLNYGFELNKNCSMSNPTLRFKDLSAIDWQCYNLLYTNEANPYDDNPTLIADFSGTLIQDPWYQAQNGGVISNSRVKGQVPVTCITNNCKISFSGLVAAPAVENYSKNLSDAQNWYYFNVLAKLADYNTNYDYFYSQYFVKKGIGTVLSGNKSILDIGTTGIYFIKGNLTIDTDKTLINPGDFLMLIVKGNINVGIGASRVDGILVANNINASGAIDNQLIFNGSLYAADSVNFSRDYSHRLTNNSTPAVIVKYDPELIFNIPGDIAKVLTNWQWGN